MTLTTGTKLGSYEVASQIGAGGMGEVYQAHGTKLGRDVAIKILPEAFAHDPERLSRFQREAKMLAALNHPNIAHIYGLEENASAVYLVMELVPGDTLADRIKRDGAIPVEEALAIAKQIAEALETAHEKGIVHRDLKPANVKVTPEGKVKVLDFGLAKAFAGDAANEDVSNSPTLSMAATMQGVILGTAAYMSPEQARGKAVDRRADIWSFGVVLHEMLTGQQLFAGETVTDTLAQVITKEPDLERIPATLQRLLRWCLEKDPNKRLRDITDGMVLVDEGPGQNAANGRAKAFFIWPWAIAAAACVVALGFAWVHFREKAANPPEAYRFTIRLPENVSFTRSAQVVLSPDGRRVAFPAAGPDGRTTVWVQDMDGEEARSLPDTDPLIDAPPFFWSPDSRYIVFSNTVKIRKTDVLGGATQDICDSPFLMIGGSWNRDGVIILGSVSTGLWRVPAEGGTAVPLTLLDASRHEHEHELPSFFPDNRHFLYFRRSDDPDDNGVYVGSLDDPPERQSKTRLLASQFGATYVPSEGETGRLLYLRDGVLTAQEFDPARLELLGQPAVVAERVGSAFETAHFSANPDVLVYRGQGPPRLFQLTWFDRTGKIVGKAGDPGPIAAAHISPDGNRVAFVKQASDTTDGDIWLLDLKTNASTRFTFGSSANIVPVWSPDSKEIVFSSNRDGAYNLYRKPADGSRAEQLLLKTPEQKRALSWSHDGRFLLFGASKNAADEQMWVLPMTGEPHPVALTHSHFDETDGQLSPDGRWIAYESKESGKYEVYVREFSASGDFSETGGKWMVSKDGGVYPRWSADGKELVYIGTDLTTIMHLSVNAERTFQPGSPQSLLKIPPNRSYGELTATPDLKRFLLPVAVDAKVPQSFTVMLNWAAGLKK
jgi:Tol biopolymer transport system component